MKDLALLVILVSLAACSKSVSKDGRVFFQENPNPAPTVVPTPRPSASPTPNPSPLPTPSPTPPSVGCDPAKVAPLLDYSAYVKNDLKTDHVDFSRRVVAGYVCAQHGSVGTALAGEATRVDLASAGVLGANHLKVPRGKATYGTTLDSVSSTALGGFSKAPTDLGANLRKILDFSNGCAKAPTNAKVIRTCRHAGADPRSPEICTVRIKGEDPRLNIAELAPAQLLNTTVYVVDVPAGSALVTNLAESRIAIFRGVEVQFAPRTASAPVGGRTYWNFPAADRLEFTGTVFHGTVVSPDADVTVAGQSGEAGFWVRGLNATDSNW